MDGLLSIALIASNTFLADPNPGLTTSFAVCLGYCHQSNRCASFFYNFDAGTCYHSFYVYSHPVYAPLLQNTVENVEYYEWKISVCNEASGWYYHRPNRICFKYTAIPSNHLTAYGQCVSEGATLIITKDYLSDIFFTHFAMTADSILWTAGYQNGSAWYWTSGDPFVYTNWKEGAPDALKKCLKFHRKYSEWTSGDCSKPFNFICQLIVEPTQDGCYSTLSLTSDMRQKLF